MALADQTVPAVRGSRTLHIPPASQTISGAPTDQTISVASTSQTALVALATTTAPGVPTIQTGPSLRIYQSTKGFVVARTGDVLTLAVGDRTVEVLVTATSHVTGLRTSAAALAPDDLIRVDGWRAATGRLIADRIVVLLVGRNAVVRPSGMVLPRVLAWILDGGVTVPLP
ncbi:MAG: hypothetical protein QN157_06890 [Armatimonadota bacterium]|nr:hypothetical protein [Armatimonadota bacterium]